MTYEMEQYILRIASGCSEDAGKLEDEFARHTNKDSVTAKRLAFEAATLRSMEERYREEIVAAAMASGVSS